MDEASPDSRESARMTARELLEAAAKAAGIVGEVEEFYMKLGDKTPILAVSTGRDVWDPLNDDGDALRLAVRLKLTISPYQEGVFVSRYEGEEVVAEPFEVIGVPDCAATRRAIVRAAAAVVPE